LCPTKDATKVATKESTKVDTGATSPLAVFVNRFSLEQREAVMPTMQQLLQKNFARPDETRTFEKGKMEIVTVGDKTFGRGVFEPGWKWSTCVKPQAQTELCECSHLVYGVSGRMRVRMADGSETELGPGDVAWIPPGHDAWVVGSEPAVAIDVMGAEEYARRA
jgi:uncharacterized RmlC-like cupin family protein